MKRRLVLALKVLVVGVLLVYMGRVLWGQGLPLERLAHLRQGWPWLVLAQALLLTTVLLTFHRFGLLLSPQGIHYTLGELAALGWIGFFFNQFIPGSTGGDLVKAWYVASDHPGRAAAAVTTVFVDRALGLVAMMTLAGVAAVLAWPLVGSQPVLRSLAWLVVGGVLGLVLCAALFFSGRVRSHPGVVALLRRLPFRSLLFQVQAAVYLYRFRIRLVLAALALSFVVQAASIGTVIAYAMALGGGVDPTTFFFVVPLAHFAMAIPTGSPGGLGQSEFAFHELFKLAGFPHGLLLALIQRVNLCLVALPGVVPYLRRRARARRAGAPARPRDLSAALEELPAAGAPEGGT